MEQTKGIEPPTSGSKPGALPLSYIRWFPTSEAAPYTGRQNHLRGRSKKLQPLCSLRLS